MKTTNRNNAGRKVGVILVGRLNGLRHIRWGVAFFLSCALGIFCGAVAVATYFALSRTFSPPAAILGFLGPFITIGVGIQKALKLPIEELSPFDG